MKRTQPDELFPNPLQRNALGNQRDDVSRLDNPITGKQCHKSTNKDDTSPGNGSGKHNLGWHRRLAGTSRTAPNAARHLEKRLTHRRDAGATQTLRNPIAATTPNSAAEYIPALRVGTPAPPR